MGHFLKDSQKPNYPQKYFEQNKKTPLMSKIFSPLLNLFYYLKTESIKNFVNKTNPKILDFGCGSGKLVDRFQNQGIEINGFEPSKGALNLTHRNKLPVYNFVKAVPGGYDLIMLWHSLEHIDQPFEAIKKIKQFLSKDGKILIAVPNGDSFDAKIFNV